MFEELLAGSQERRVDKDILSIWAQQAAKSYIDENIDLSEKVASIAKSENLNPTQIQRLVEETNVTTEAFIRTRGGNDFPVAKTEEVLDKLSMKETKPMGTIGDYYSLPTGEYGQNLYDLFGVAPQKAEFMTEKQAASYKIEKLAHEKKTAEDRMVILEMKKEAQLKTVIETIKQAIMRDKEDVNELFKMACYAGLEKIAREVFPTVAFVLVEQEVIEKSAFIAPEEYISENLKGKVHIVNGNHPVLISLRDLNNLSDEVGQVKLTVYKADEGLRNTAQRLKQL